MSSKIIQNLFFYDFVTMCSINLQSLLKIGRGRNPDWNS